MPILRDISIYFSIKSDCCLQSSKKPCRNSAQPPDPNKFFRYWFNRDIDVDVATITIGKKWIGCKSAEQQYEIMVRDIKKAYPYHGDTKYKFHFELQKNGMLHAHGVIVDGHQSRFIESFSSYGSRNTRNESYQKCRNIDGYLDYIDKENAFPCIHNIKKSDMIDIGNSSDCNSGQGESRLKQGELAKSPPELNNKTQCHNPTSGFCTGSLKNLRETPKQKMA